MKTVLVSEAKPILDELVRKAAMGQEIRISTGGFVARLVAGTEARSTGKEMVVRVRKWGLRLSPARRFPIAEPRVKQRRLGS